MSLAVGYEQMKAYRDYQTMSLLMSQVFGGSEKKKEIKPPSTLAEAEAQLSRLFNG